MAIGDSTRTVQDTQNISISFQSFERGFVLDMKDVEMFYFIDDIFQHCMTGVLRFRDVYGFAEFAPLTGDNEKIIITYGEDSDITLAFDVYKINEIAGATRASTAARSIIEITFVDDNFHLMTQQKWSRSFKQQSISSIVQHLARNMLETSINNIEPSSEEIDFVMPWWTVQQALMWLSKRATSSESGKYGYLFYNNPYRLSYVTLDKLLRGSVRTAGNTADLYRFEKPDEPYYKNRILGWSIMGIDNYFMKYIRGNNRFGYDFETKSLLNTRHLYTDGLNNVTVLGRKALFSDVGTSRADYVLEGDSDSKILETTFNSDFTKRYSSQQAIKIIVRGHEERASGDLIEIEWPSTEKRLIHNEQMKGLYLIKSVTNQWSPSRPAWIQKLVLLKNGYTRSRNRNLVNSTRKNLYGSTAEGTLSNVRAIAGV